MANKQPFYHHMEVMFTATEDVTGQMDQEFLKKLGGFLKRNLGGGVIVKSVEFDGPPTAEPGDPMDLM